MESRNRSLQCSVKDHSMTMKPRKRTGALFLIAIAMAALLMIAAPVRMKAAEADPLSGDDLDGVKVRIRPAGSHKPLSINDDGNGTQNVVHLYYNGKSSHFHLFKAGTDSYYINFYQHYYDESPKTDDDCRLDVERTKNDDSYLKEGQVIHVVTGNSTAKTKQWQFIPTGKGTYYIRNIYSKLYWSPEDTSKIKENGTKLIQSKTPFEWEMEIVSRDNKRLKSIKKHDSYNFKYKGSSFDSTNWMSGLPDSLKVSDISIPGTHDVGTCHLNKSQGGMSDQRYHIDEMLNAGVRHLDVRTAVIDGNVCIVHSDADALNHSGDKLQLKEVMGWIRAFLKDNPSETVIIQVKEDRDKDDCAKKTYETLESYAKEAGNSLVWARSEEQDQVPALGEVRGKAIVISRLNLEKYPEKDFTFEKEVEEKNDGGETVKTKKTFTWSIDCHNWKQSKDKATALTASDYGYEVWTQDNWKNSAGDKKPYIRAALLGNNDDGDNSTLQRYEDAKRNGKDAWVFNYTSASNKHKSAGLVGSVKDTPYDISKSVHQWLIDRYGYNSKDHLVCEDTFTGIMAFDFVDEYLAAMIYKTNYNRKYVTIHGISVDGKEPIKPLTLSVGMLEKPDKLLNNLNNEIIKKHFLWGSYEPIPADNGDYLTSVNMTDQGEASKELLNTLTKECRDSLEEGNLAGDYYVYVSKPITALDKVEFDIEMPSCGTQLSGGNAPVGITDMQYPQVFIDDRAPYEPAKGSNWPAHVLNDLESGSYYEGKISGVDKMPLEVLIAPKWGYHFLQPVTMLNRKWTFEPSIVFETGSFVDSEITKEGLLKVRGTAAILHEGELVEVEQSATCESPGIRRHYECKLCGHRLITVNMYEGDPGKPSIEFVADDTIFSKANVESSGKLNLLAASSDDIILSQDGEENNNTLLSDETADRSKMIEIDEEDLITPAFGHEWGDWSVTRQASPDKNGEMTRTCKNDPGHVQTMPIPPVGHVHQQPLIHVEAVEAKTCSENGSIEYWKCEDCGCFFADETGTTQICEEDISISGDHEWDEATYKREGFYGEDQIVIASRVCKLDPGHIEKEAARVKVSSVEPTCTTPGNHHEEAVFKNKAFSYSSDEPIQALDHSWDEGKVTKEATCISEGLKTYTCERCGETETEVIPADENAHVTYTVEGSGSGDESEYDSESSIEDKIDLGDNTATCTEGGTQTQTEICSICGKTISTSRVATEPLGHDWDDVSYEWSEDKSTVIAKSVCMFNPEHVETETATTTKTVRFDCENGERDCYYASFDKEIFDPQELLEKDGRNPGHNWGSAVYIWSKDNSTVTASRICSRDEGHIEKETAKTQSKVIQAATTTSDGKTTYTAAFKNPGFAKQTKTVSNINKIKSISLEKTSFAYNGSVQKPAVAVLDSAGKTIDSRNYTVSYLNNNSKKPGAYKVKITFKENYSGSKTLEYKIVRGKNKATKVTTSKTIKYGKLKKKNQSFKIKAKVKEKAKKSFKLKSVPKKAKKYISVNKTGKVTVKKGLAKGTYSVKVKITAAKTKNYKKTTVTRTVKVTVK